MQRSYDPNSLVTLPRLDAANAVTLVTALITAARSIKKLPPAIAPAFAKLTAALAPLQQGLQDRLSAPLVDPVAAKAADQQEDAAWSAFHDWLNGWAKLPGAQGKAAAELQQMLFPDGLKFILVVYTQEWAEVESRLLKIHAGGHEKTINDLGGAPFLAFMRAAHKQYGEILGITTVKGAPALAAAVGDPLLALTKAIRNYVVKVTAHSDEDDAASMDLAEQLLRPLTSWVSPATAPRTQKTAPAPAKTTQETPPKEAASSPSETPPAAPTEPTPSRKKG